MTTSLARLRFRPGKRDAGIDLVATHADRLRQLPGVEA